MRRFAVIASLTVAFHGSGAWAADEFVYVVNGTGGPVQVVVDAQAFPPMDHLMALNVRATAGSHTILAGVPQPIIGGEIKSTGTSISPNLSLEDGTIDKQKRTFWCFVVGKQADGALRIVAAKPPTCAELIRRGVGDRTLK